MEQKRIIISIIAFVILLLIILWVIGVYSQTYPGPDRPDGNFLSLIALYNSYDKSLWFRNNECIFNEQLSCRKERFIVYESSGEIVYDSKNNRNWKRFPFLEDAKLLRSSVEYGRAVTLTQGVVLRNKVNNLCELVKNGDSYRIVHISEYIYNSDDKQY